MSLPDRQQSQPNQASNTFPLPKPSAVLRSSFSSSASPYMLQHAVSGLNSSHSDITTPDRFTPLTLNTPTKTQLASAIASPPTRSSSMGQTSSQPSSSAPSPSSSPNSSNFSGPPSVSKGFKLKRAFGVRRKQSEDINRSQLSLNSTSSNGDDSQSTDGSMASMSQSSSSPQRRPLRARQLTLQLASAFSPKQNPPGVGSPVSPGLPPPTPPPKSSRFQAKKKPSLAVQPSKEDRGSVMVSSPSIAAALQYMQSGQTSPEKGGVSSQVVVMEKVNSDAQEVWRKSDSHMSFNTIRPGAATVGNRSSRPVSMAESVQSTHTIVPINRRLSALVSDTDYVMAEEDTGGQGTITPSPSSLALSGKASPSGSIKSKNRRSASFSIPPPPFIRSMAPSPASTTVSDDTVRTSRETSTLTRAAASGYIAPVSSENSIQTTGNNIKGRLVAWSATNSPSPPQHDEQMSGTPNPSFSQCPRQPRITPAGHGSPPTFRQTAVSITSGFAPAAGLAKRAVEKMGRAWGGIHNSNASNVYTSSSSTSVAASSQSGNSADDLRSNRQNQGLLTPGSLRAGKGKQRRTPNAPSGSWSVSSLATSSSVSDSGPPGPSLGTCLRIPRRSGHKGELVKGMVFGRGLQSCTAETKLSYANEVGSMGRPAHDRTTSAAKTDKDADDRELETRRVPALVVRCAQHILAWGVQEEGLFRVTGRPSHVSKIRTEFDAGADYNLSECNIGDLDPHSVSSVFKAYLRELPEPILTHALMPYFDAAMSVESQDRQAQVIPQVALGQMRGQPLPGNPKAGGSLPIMRKPPSLSTLAMPTFSGMRPPSDSLVDALKSLISALPKENHDLLRTVTDLIRATSKRSKETKMPLSNLLLVFCPSLNMNPPLLRALCEAEGIWDTDNEHDADEFGVLHIKRDTVIFDIRSQDTSTISDNADDRKSFVTDRTSSSGSSPAPARRPLPVPPSQVRREPVSTMYYDTEDGDGLLLQSGTVEIDSANIPDDISLSSADPSDISRSSSVSPGLLGRHSPPSLTSSTDSLPTTSSGVPSSSHLPLHREQIDKTRGFFASHSPIIAEAVDLPLASTPQRANISFGNVQFPSSGSAPTPPVSRRPSVPILSVGGVNLVADNAPPSANPTSSSRTRLKKPSLTMLFTRRSSASLHSVPLSAASISAPTAYLQPPGSTSPTSDTAVSTPLSALIMYTAHTSTSSLPPTLDVAIDPSPFRVGMGLDEERRRTLAAKAKSEGTVPDTHPPLPAVNVKPLGPNETPIADLYGTPSGSVNSFDPNENVTPLRPRLKTRPSQASTAPSYDHLSIALPDKRTTEDDNWAQSVLAATNTEGSWAPNIKT